MKNTAGLDREQGQEGEACPLLLLCRTDLGMGGVPELYLTYSRQGLQGEAAWGARLAQEQWQK